MIKIPLFLAAFSIAGAITFADQPNTTDRVKDTAKEAICADGDAVCLAKKAQHRGEEGADYVKDKVDKN